MSRWQTPLSNNFESCGLNSKLIWATHCTPALYFLGWVLNFLWQESISLWWRWVIAVWPSRAETQAGAWLWTFFISWIFVSGLKLVSQGKACRLCFGIDRNLVVGHLDYGFGQTCILCISWALDYVLCARPFGNGKWGKATYMCSIWQNKLWSSGAHICFWSTSKVDSKYTRLKREQSSYKRHLKEVGGLL